MMFAIEYIFTENDFRFINKGKKTFKLIATLYIEKIKEHFTVYRDKAVEKVLNISFYFGKLIGKLEKIKVDKADDSDDEEGFYGSSDEEYKD